MASHIAGLYDMEDTLGSGHFAVVKSARHVFTGLRVAIKVIDKMKLDEVSKAHLYQEVRCMKLVIHPSIIRLYEVIDTQTKLYLIQVRVCVHGLYGATHIHTPWKAASVGIT